MVLYYDLGDAEWQWKPFWSDKCGSNLSLTGHCGVLLQDLLILLAGIINYEDNQPSRPNFDIFSLNIKTMELNRVKIRGARLSSRRMMAACTDGIRITAIGGMDENYTTLGDISVFSLSNFL